MRKIILVLLSLTLLLSACAKTTEEVITISQQQEYASNSKINIARIGQWCGFNTESDSIFVYPYYNQNSYVKVDSIQLSGNNFWYDLVTSKGYTLQNVKTYEDGIMMLETGGGVYGWVTLNENLGVLGFTNNLPSGYVKVVLEHVSSNN